MEYTVDICGEPIPVMLSVIVVVGFIATVISTLHLDSELRKHQREMIEKERSEEEDNREE
jgi:hypothetical protein